MARVCTQGVGVGVDAKEAGKVSSRSVAELNKDTALPPAVGVKVPGTASVKLMSAVLAGAESEIDTLSNALPPPPPPLLFGAPLQEARERAASGSKREAAFRRFMEHPTSEFAYSER